MRPICILLLVDGHREHGAQSTRTVLVTASSNLFCSSDTPKGCWIEHYSILGLASGVSTVHHDSIQGELKERVVVEAAYHAEFFILSVLLTDTHMKSRAFLRLAPFILRSNIQ